MTTTLYLQMTSASMSVWILNRDGYVALCGHVQTDCMYIAMTSALPLGVLIQTGLNLRPIVLYYK